MVLKKPVDSFQTVYSVRHQESAFQLSLKDNYWVLLIWVSEFYTLLKHSWNCFTSCGVCSTAWAYRLPISHINNPFPCRLTFTRGWWEATKVKCLTQGHKVQWPRFKPTLWYNSAIRIWVWCAILYSHDTVDRTTSWSLCYEWLHSEICLYSLRFWLCITLQEETKGLRCTLATVWSPLHRHDFPTNRKQHR